MICPTGEAHDHRKRTLLYTRGRDIEPTLRAKGDIILRVGSWITISICVDTEDREVPRMTWIPPVIRISTKLTNGTRRCTHEAYI